MSTAPKLPWKHHYVPQFLLRNFTGEKGQLYVFDKLTEKTFQSTTGNVAAEGGFYDFELGGDRHSMEAHLSQIESRTASIISSILRDQSLARLTRVDRETVSLFAAIQQVRVNSVRHRIRSINVGIRGELARRMIDAEKVLPALDDAGVKFQAISLIHRAEEFAKFFYEKAWVLQRSPEGDPLYISDNPITLHNLVERPGRGNLGLNSLGIEIYLPISQQFSICFFCQRTHHRILQALQGVAEHERGIGPFPIDLSSMRKLSDVIAGGTPEPLLPDNVIHLNHLQVLFSSRFIYSATDNFALVRSMLLDNSNLKHPRKLVIQ
jgi:Protein of unknown function (DUF4238)